MRKDEKKQEHKNSIINSATSKFKNDFAEEALSKGGTALGTAYGVKKGLSLGQAAVTKGLAGSTIGTAIGATTVPNIRLKRMFNKELNENPSKKDYAKITAANVIPSAVGLGMVYKNKDDLAKGANKAIDVIKKMKDTKLDSSGRKSIINSAKKNIGKLPSKAIKGAKYLAKNPKYLAGAAALGGLEAANMLVTPEKLVEKRRKEKMQKKAGEITLEAYEQFCK